MKKARIEVRRQQARRRQVAQWSIGGSLVVALIAVAGWLLSRGGGGTPFISRLSTSDFHSLAFSPTKPETVFFGHHGGLMVSDDGGRTWRPASLHNADAMALAAPPFNPQIMYAAGHGVLTKSSDGGLTWQTLAANLPGTDIHGFAAAPQDANHVFAYVVGFGIWASQDGGLIWQLLSATVPTSTFNLVIGQTEQTLYAAAGQAGLWRSQDGGNTWAAMPSMPGGGMVALAFDSSGGRLFATATGNEAGLYASGDDGATWTALGLKGALLAIAVSPLDPKHMLAVDQTGRVYASRDGGATWTK